LRNQAIAKREATIAAINAQFATDRRTEDQEFDAVFDRARQAYEDARKRRRPDYALAKVRRDAALEDAEKLLDREIRLLYIKYGQLDSRFNKPVGEL